MDTANAPVVKVVPTPEQTVLVRKNVEKKARPAQPERLALEALEERAAPIYYSRWW
jgi:hypothetical protein